MLLLLPVLAAAGLGLLVGGDWRRLAGVPAWVVVPVAALVALQFGLYLPVLATNTAALAAGGAIYTAALTLNLLVALAGATRPGPLRAPCAVAALGITLNVAVVAANGGSMPVERAAVLHARGPAHVRALAARAGTVYTNAHLADGGARLRPLDDRIPIAVPGNHGNVYSVGDALLVLGLALLAYRRVRTPGAATTAATRAGVA